MKATVVCISAADGAEGHAVGRLVADRLGFRFADDAIVVAAARTAGLLPEALAEAESRHAGRTLEVDFGRVERTETLRALIKEAVVLTAEEGNVVIVAHAASYALAGRDGVLRVFVTAPRESRVARVASAGGLREKDAAKRIAESDDGRAVYLDRFYDVKRELPTDYDLVVNTDLLSAEEAAAAIVALAS